MHELISSFTYCDNKVIICVSNQINNPANNILHFKQKKFVIVTVSSNKRFSYAIMSNLGIRHTTLCGLY